MTQRFYYSMLFNSAQLISGEVLFLYLCLADVLFFFKYVGSVFEYLCWKGFQEVI